MRAPSRSPWLAALAPSAAALFIALDTGCALDHACTLVGCVDQARLTLRTPSGGLTAGGYDVQLNVDGMAVDCTLPVSDSASSFAQGACSSRLAALDLEAEVTCHSVSQGNAVGQSCTPVPGQFHMTVVLMGTPAQADLVVLRDGVEVGRDAVALQYASSQPNGPSCDPTCHQASADVSLAN